MADPEHAPGPDARRPDAHGPDGQGRDTRGPDVQGPDSQGHGPGPDALAALDKVLQERPDKVGHDFSAATRLLAVYRDSLSAEWRKTRAEADRQRLARANAVLSVVVGGHFPLGPVPWPHIEKGRDELAALVKPD